MNKNIRRETIFLYRHTNKKILFYIGIFLYPVDASNFHQKGRKQAVLLNRRETGFKGGTRPELNGLYDS